MSYQRYQEVYGPPECQRADCHEDAAPDGYNHCADHASGCPKCGCDHLRRVRGEGIVCPNCEGACPECDPDASYPPL